MNLFKKSYSFVRLGRTILKIEDIKDVAIIIAPGLGKELATAPFKLKISMKYYNNIEIEYDTWEERQEVFDMVWNLVKDL